MVNTKILQVRPDDTPDRTDPKNQTRGYKRALKRHNLKQSKKLKKLKPIYDKRNARFNKVIQEHLEKTVEQLEAIETKGWSSTDKYAIQELIKFRKGQDEAEAKVKAHSVDVTRIVENPESK